ncbi:MAG: hypothetical protein IKQ51_10750 [Bacteroidaceae bacterium]|nr:hypothetical protein [Bacteroidaceae bacterium]
MEQDKIQHLEFIQNNINRMNSNSFQIKEWMITIVSALLALYVSSGNENYIFLAILPTVLFWFLDAYYLLQERKFRCLYNDILSEDTEIPPFAIPINSYDSSILKTLFSKTIGSLYGIIVLLLILGGVVLKYFA